MPDNIDDLPWPLIIASLKSDRSIKRIKIACDILPIQPEWYRNIFNGLSYEISRNGVSSDIVELVAAGTGYDRSHVQSTLTAIKRSDPWLENGSSPYQLSVAAWNSLVDQCRSNGMTVTKSDSDAIWTWLGCAAIHPSPNFRPK